MSSNFDDYREPTLLVMDPDNWMTDWLITPAEMVEFYDEPTLVRSLINFDASLTTLEGTTSPGTIVSGAIGIIECNSADPDGLDPAIPWALDPGHDWIWHYVWILGNANTGQTVPITTVNQSNMTGAEFFDIRSKRKFRNGYGLGISVVSSSTSEVPISIAWATRHLLLN